VYRLDGTREHQLNLQGDSMDHSEQDKRFCVYFFRCNATNNVVYIGHGNSERPFVKTNRSVPLKCFMDNNEYSIEIIHNDLSKQEAIGIESEYLDKYVNNNSDGFALLNINKGYKTKEVSYKYFQELFYYDESSPTFLRWKVDRFGTGSAKIMKAGDVAGNVCKSNNVYPNVSVNYKTYVVHRIIYAICNEVDVPTNLVVDHIDGNKSNNDIRNLQLLTQSQNIKKADRNYIQSNNSSGVVGVHYLETEYNRYWTASITYETKKRKTKNFNIDKLGYDEAFRSACECRRQMEELYYKQ
jgi:hypothetical protein